MSEYIEIKKVDGKTICLGEGRAMSEQAMHALFELKENGQLCDAIVRLDDGTSYNVHRAILSACSSYFRVIFTTTLHPTDFRDVTIPGISKDIMDQFVNYAYLRKVKVTMDNAFDLLVYADYLGIVGIIHLCCEYLKSSLSPMNCIGIMRFAKDHFCMELGEESQIYLLRNFVDVLEESQELIELSLDNFKSIINHDYLNIKSEETAWRAILKWIAHDEENRKGFIVPLMQTIRLGLLETEFFLEHVKDHPYVATCDASRPVILETLKFLYDLEMIASRDGEVPTPEIARPRVPHEILFAIGGWSGGAPTSYIETYDTRADRWVKVEEVDPVGPRAYHGTAVIGYCIYVIGGFDGMDYFNSCRCFNAVAKTWREVAPMNARRCYVSVTTLDDIIYAMGGYDGHHRQNTAEKYDYRTNQWSLIAPMNMQRSDACACTLDGKVYITGGFNGQECMNSSEVYDPELNQWSAIAAMRSRRSGVSCIAYYGKVYVLGGFNGISRMCSGEKYDPGNNSWSEVRDMYNPRSNFAVEIIDDMIFAIGGFNGVTTIYHVECYDIKTNYWYEATDMNIYRSALSACVINGLPNVRDYIHKHRERLMEEKRLKMLEFEQRQQGNLADININDNNNNNNQNPGPAHVGVRPRPIIRNPQLNVLQMFNDVPQDPPDDNDDLLNDNIV